MLKIFRDVIFRDLKLYEEPQNTFANFNLSLLTSVKIELNILYGIKKAAYKIINNDLLLTQH